MPVSEPDIKAFYAAYKEVTDGWYTSGSAVKFSSLNILLRIANEWGQSKALGEHTEDEAEEIVNRLVGWAREEINSNQD